VLDQHIDFAPQGNEDRLIRRAGGNRIDKAFCKVEVMRKRERFSSPTRRCREARL
jgi:hypothetical protein